MDQAKFEDLIKRRIKAKRDEDDAAEIRKTIDKEIDEVISEGKDRKGTISAKLSDIGVKVSVSYGVTRKADTEYIEANWPTIPNEIKACLKQKFDVSSSFDKLPPELKFEAAKFIETKDSSPSIKIEVI